MHKVGSWVQVAIATLHTDLTYDSMIHNLLMPLMSYCTLSAFIIY